MAKDPFDNVLVLLIVLYFYRWTHNHIDIKHQLCKSIIIIKIIYIKIIIILMLKSRIENMLLLKKNGLLLLLSRTLVIDGTFFWKYLQIFWKNCNYKYHRKLANTWNIS